MKKIPLFIAVLCLMLSCSKEKDPCKGKICENGGTCIDGTCNCPHLWKGENCTEQVTPLLITIGSVEVTKLPPTDANGSGWDLTSGPDIYVVVKQAGTVLLSTQSQWVQNATFGAIWNTPFSTNLALLPVDIELWDYDDFDADDYMGGVAGFIYSDTNKFPQSIILDCGPCTVAIRFSSVTYL